ncbi:MAG TPA: phytanoyl-CoA dioxygenase family protein [Thermoanaerobaculia bacterium]|jgi:ectoine hydroxylase-related dioxygenase (phytanoyl-CoA dioxygenase family)
MTDELRLHGIREIHRNSDRYDAHLEEIRTIGYTIVDGGLSAAELASYAAKIDAIYERQVRECGGAEALERINDSDVARSALAYDDDFVRLAAHPAVMAILRRILGEHFILMSQNGIINRPGASPYSATWHRDLNWQHFVSSRPLSMSALVCIDEFREETGATYMLPASHKSEEFPSPEYVAKHQVAMTAPAGSILVFDAMVYHRGGVNRSARPRRAVNHIYTLPLIKQQMSFPKMLNGKFSDDPFLRGLLGYDSETADSAHAWREKRIAAAMATARV